MADRGQVVAIVDGKSRKLPRLPFLIVYEGTVYRLDPTARRGLILTRAKAAP